MNTSTQTTVTGAALGAAVGCILVWLLETYAGSGDIPSTVEGAVVVVCTALIALVYPPSR